MSNYNEGLAKFLKNDPNFNQDNILDVNKTSLLNASDNLQEEEDTQEVSSDDLMELMIQRDKERAEEKAKQIREEKERIYAEKKAKEENENGSNIEETLESTSDESEELLNEDDSEEVIEELEEQEDNLEESNSDGKTDVKKIEEEVIDKVLPKQNTLQLHITNKPIEKETDSTASLSSQIIGSTKNELDEEEIKRRKEKIEEEHRRRDQEYNKKRAQEEQELKQQILEAEQAAKAETEVKKKSKTKKPNKIDLINTIKKATKKAPSVSKTKEKEKVPFASKAKATKLTKQSNIQKSTSTVNKNNTINSVTPDKLTRLAFYDNVLKVKNRNAYQEEINEQAIPILNYQLFCYIDINNLKFLNDNYGHSEGDKLLSTCIGELSNEFSPDNIYRLGGDEFLIVLPNENADFESKIQEVLTKLNKINELYTFSYGIERSNGALRVSDLIKKAESKMYVMKQEYHKNHAGSQYKIDIDTVRSVFKETIKIVKQQCDEIANLFIITYDEKLFILDKPYKFLQQLENISYNSEETEIYCSIFTYKDNNNVYAISEEKHIPDPFENLQKVDEALKTRILTAEDLQEFTELCEYNEVFF